jgi:hypothetical protein
MRAGSPRVSVWPFAAALALAVIGGVGCDDGGAAGIDGEGAPTDEPRDAPILLQYLGEHRELVSGHQHWHSENYRSLPDYGDLFLAFHRKLVRDFDVWRAERGYPPLRPWDPATPIPAQAAHPGRLSENPSAVDPLCRRPTWFTVEGGTTRDPDFGAARLGDFPSANQFGRAIDSVTPPAWHTRVHWTIGGDMVDQHRVVLDPIFWRFHKFIDHLWDEWQQETP